MTKNLIKQVMLKPTSKKHFLDPNKLIEKINSGYIAKIENKHTQKKTFAPSTIAFGHGECPRYWYLAFEGNIFENNNTPYDIANMTSGTKSHDRIQQAMMDSGLAKKFPDEKYFEETGKEKDTTEFKITHSDPPIFGWGDAMLNWEDEEIICEIKTTNNDAFDYFKNNKKPKKGHVIQLLIYMKILKKSKGVLVYENKNNHDLLVFPIEINDVYIKWIDDAFEWMREVKKASKNKTLPQKNYRSNAKICKTCPVKTACSNAGDGVIKIKSLEELSEIVQ